MGRKVEAGRCGSGQEQRGVFTAALSRPVRAATSALHMELLAARGAVLFF